MANNFQILLEGILSSSTEQNLEDEIKKISENLKKKDLLKLEIDNASISQDALDNIKKQINALDLKIDLTGVNIDWDEIRKNAQQNGQNVGKAFLQGVGTGVQNNQDALENFKKSLSNIKMEHGFIDDVAKRVESFKLQIDSLKQSVQEISHPDGSVQHLLNVEIKGKDEFGQVVSLVEQWDTDTQELLKSTDMVSSAMQKAGGSASNFIDKQKTAVSNLTNQINQMYKAATDQNASRPISKQEHLDELKRKYEEIQKEIANLATASEGTFTDQQNKVKSLIAELKILRDSYKNAENVSTKLSADKLETGISKVKSDFSKLESDIKMSGIKLPDSFNQDLEKIRTALTQDLDAGKVRELSTSISDLGNQLKALERSNKADEKLKQNAIAVQTLKEKIDAFANANGLGNFSKEINGSVVTVQSLKDELDKFATSGEGDLGTINKLWIAFQTAAKNAGLVTTQTAQTSAQALQDIQNAIANGDYTAHVSRLTQGFRSIGLSEEDVKTRTAELSQALTELNNATPDQLIAKEKAFQEALTRTRNALTIARANAKEYINDFRVKNLSNNIQKWLLSNTAATKSAHQELNGYISELNSGKITPKRFNEISLALKKVENDMRTAGRLGKSFADTIKSGVASFVPWLSTTRLIMSTINGMKQMVSAAKELDYALTNISYTMQITGSQLEKIGTSSVKMATDLKTSVDNVLSAVKLYANAKETADSILNKAKPAIMLSNVTGMTGEESAKMLQSVMNQFDLTEDNLMEISDTIQSVSQNMAYDFSSGIKEIAEGISVSGSVAKSAGLDLQEYASMLGLVIEKTGQSGSVVGNAYKTNDCLYVQKCA